MVWSGSIVQTVMLYVFVCIAAYHLERMWDVWSRPIASVDGKQNDVDGTSECGAPQSIIMGKAQRTLIGRVLGWMSARRSWQRQGELNEVQSNLLYPYPTVLSTGVYPPLTSSSSPVCCCA